MARRALDSQLRRRLRLALLNLAGDGLGQSLVERLAPITDGEYDPIRKMLAKVNRASLSLRPTRPAAA